MPENPRGYYLHELLATTFPPDNDALIDEGLLARNAIMVIGGPPKAYKSFVLGTIICHLATGTNLFGAYRAAKHGGVLPAFNVRRQCRVLLLEQEIGVYDLKLRYNELFQRLSPSERTLMGENVALYSCDPDLQLNTPLGCQKIMALIDQYKPDVLCLDPLIEFHTLNENDTQSMRLVMANLDKIRHHRDLAVIINHHTGKGGAELMRSGPDLLRGNSVIFAKGDSYLMLSPKNRKAGIIEIEFTVRRGKPIENLTLKLDWDDLRAKFKDWGAYRNAKGKSPDLPDGLRNIT